MTHVNKWIYLISLLITTRKLSSCDWFFGCKMAQIGRKDRLRLILSVAYRQIVNKFATNFGQPYDMFDLVTCWLFCDQKIGRKCSIQVSSSPIFSVAKSVANFKLKKKKKNQNILKSKFQTPEFNNSSE